MSEPRRPLTEHHRRFDLLTNEVARLWQTLPPRDRLVVGLVHALRAVLAASLGYFAALELGLGQGFWAAITAISVSQSSYAEVRSSSRDQFVGAMIGGLIGLGAAMLGHDHYLAYVLAVIAGMLLCSVFDLGAAGRISGITTTIIMLVPHNGAFWQFALFRLGEVTLGAAAALLVTLAFGLLERRLFGNPPSS
ncbi:FUSC family protein [Rhodanobacter sp. C01]|uniref:FUSC family protein n=1 Tax=Rhodanobacter sp. C01 TaxID=1945856 RepID=UPI00098565CE|nr:FUSC family protein [Rhodanobacter sp. C01]